jgi:hypothetical protein
MTGERIAMRRALRRRLRSLAFGELTATIVFAVVLARLQAQSGGWLVGPFAWFGYATLALILLQGTLYWFVALRRTAAPRQPRGRARLANGAAPFVRALYLANVPILIAFPLFVMVRAVRGEVAWNTGDPWLGLGLYLFAMGEFVHYFVLKITRSERDRAAHGRWQPARFRRELTRGT